MLALNDVAQGNFLDDCGLLIVLSSASYALFPSARCLTATFLDGRLITFPLDALEAMNPLAGLKRAKRIAAIHRSSSRAHAPSGRSSALSSRVRCRARPIFLCQTTRTCAVRISRRSGSCYRAGTTRYEYTRRSTSPCNRALFTFYAQNRVWRA